MAAEFGDGAGGLADEGFAGGEVGVEGGAGGERGGEVGLGGEAREEFCTAPGAGGAFGAGEAVPAVVGLPFRVAGEGVFVAGERGAGGLART